MITKINHIAIVVPELKDATAFWGDVLGLPVTKIEQIPEQDVAVAFLPVGDSKVELVQPISEESGVARYLAKHGGGMHHLCFEVDDIEAALAALKAANIRLIDETPRLTPDNKKMAFIHPQGTGGVLIELYELPLE